MIARVLASALAAAALVAAACGGGNGGATPTAPAASPTAVASPTPTAVACPTPPAENLGTLRRQQTSASGLIATLTDVQVATDACVDTITFTFSGDTLPGYDVHYVQNWTECGSGEPVYTQGPAQLAITFIPTNAHDDAGNSTITARSFLPAYPSIKEARLTCDFEAHVSWAVGTEMRYFTVTTAQSPARIVVRVWH